VRERARRLAAGHPGGVRWCATCPTEGWAPTAPARIGTRTSDATSYGLSAAAAVLGVVARRCMAGRRGSTVGTWDSQVRVSRWSTNGVPRTVIVGDVVVTLPTATTVPPRRPARAHSVPVRAPQGQQAAAPRSADGTRACMHWGSGQIERRHWVADAVVAFRIKSYERHLVVGFVDARSTTAQWTFQATPVGVLAGQVRTGAAPRKAQVRIETLIRRGPAGGETAGAQDTGRLHGPLRGYRREPAPPRRARHPTRVPR
jgi:hypothetical protein